MKRITIAALAGAALLCAGAANAQQGIDFTKVEIKTTDLGNKTYMLEGAGGNITVAVGTDGIIMVDTSGRRCTKRSRPRSRRFRRCRSNTSSAPTITAITSTETRCSTRQARRLWRTIICASAWPPALPTCSTATRCRPPPPRRSRP